MHRQSRPDLSVFDRPAPPTVASPANFAPVGLPEMIAAIGWAGSTERCSMLRADQRRRWLGGFRVSVEEYLRHLPAPADPDLVLDLISGEFLLRQEQGERPEPGEYVRRFPAHAQ